MMLRWIPVLLLSLVLHGCATSGKSSRIAERKFTFAKDTFAFANELYWEYRMDPATGQMTSRDRQPPPQYALRCFVMSRSARQFFQHARFDASKPKVSEATYRQLIRKVVGRSPRTLQPQAGCFCCWRLPGLLPHPSPLPLGEGASQPITEEFKSPRYPANERSFSIAPRERAGVREKFQMSSTAWECLRLQRSFRAKERIVIPGFSNLREFSEAHEKLLKAECGGAWQSYFQRGHWRMIFPFSRSHQERMAAQLAQAIERNSVPVVHLVRFPRLTINHAVLLFGFAESVDGIEFLAYDPNDPEKPAILNYERRARTFTFPPNSYFAGGRVDVYEVYHAVNY